MSFQVSGKCAKYANVLPLIRAAGCISRAGQLSQVIEKKDSFVFSLYLPDQASAEALRDDLQNKVIQVTGLQVSEVPTFQEGIL